MAVKFKAKGKVTEDRVEVKLTIKGLESFVDDLRGFKPKFDCENFGVDLKQLKLPNNQGIMFIVSN